MTSELRRAAEAVPDMLDNAAHWLMALPLENTIPHAMTLRDKADELRSALSAPDELAEAETITVERIPQDDHVMAITFDELEQMASELDTAKDKWLRSMGWDHDCGHPGGLWLWHKEIEGRLYMVDRSTAMFLEEQICPVEQFGEPIDG